MSDSAEDRALIWDAMSRYARALDRRDWALLDGVFDPELIATYGGQPSPPGRAAVVAGIRGHLDGCGPSQHLLGNFSVTIVGDAAESRTYIRVFHIGRPPRTEDWFETFGEYHAGWRRGPEGWRAVRWELEVFVNRGDITILGPG